MKLLKHEKSSCVAIKSIWTYMYISKSIKVIRQSTVNCSIFIIILFKTMFIQQCFLSFWYFDIWRILFLNFQENEKESGNLCSGQKCLLPIFQFLFLISVTTSLVFCGIINIKNASFFGQCLLMLNLTRSTSLKNHIFGTDNKNAKAQNAGILYRFLRIVTCILILSVYIAFCKIMMTIQYLHFCSHKK